MGIENENTDYHNLERQAKEIIGRASDMEIAIFLMKHIDDPCSTNLLSGAQVNIREFYIRIANEIIPKMTNENARILLENKVKEHSK